MSIKGVELAKACALAAEEIQAEEIKVLDMRELSSLTDFMIVCSGKSMPHLKAVISEIGKTVHEAHGVSPHMSDGKSGSSWVVLDYIDVMVHVMDVETRELYGLENLWGQAPEVEWK